MPEIFFLIPFRRDSPLEVMATPNIKTQPFVFHRYSTSQSSRERFHGILKEEVEEVRYRNSQFKLRL